MKNITELYQIKEQLRHKIACLRQKSFRIWQDGNKIKLQCCIIHGNKAIEFYGNIYEVIDIDNGILQVSN